MLRRLAIVTCSAHKYCHMHYPVINQCRNVAHGKFPSSPYYARLHRYSTDTGRISPTSLKSLAEEKSVYIIDLRPIQDVPSQRRYPGSIYIPLAELEIALHNMPKEVFKNKYGKEPPEIYAHVVFVCKYGYRSSVAQKIAQELGFMNVKFSPMGT